MLPVLQEFGFRVLHGEEACTKCEGACCKRFPGETLPEQWKVDGELDWDKIKQALISKRWVVDWMERDHEWYPEGAYGNAPFIRPAHENSAAVLDTDTPLDLETACTFLGVSGCSLASDDRPAGCRALEAYLVESEDGLDRQCGYRGITAFKSFVAKSWFPYREQLLSTAAIAQEHIESQTC